MTDNLLESLRALSFLMPQGPAPEEYPIRVVALEDAERVLAQRDATAITKQEPAAWISFCVLNQKEYFDRLPIQSIQPGVYKHTPLYAAPRQEEPTPPTEPGALSLAESMPNTNADGSYIHREKEPK